jgi:hypothetical protein
MADPTAFSQAECVFCQTDLDSLWAVRLELVDGTTNVELGYFVCTRCVNIATLSGYGVRQVASPRLERGRAAGHTVILAVFITAGIVLGALLAIAYPELVS